MKSCKNCFLEKKLSEFSYHSSNECYSRVCKDCVNTKRRDKFKKERGDKFDYTHSKNRSKLCINCKELKLLNIQNFSFIDNCYDTYCRVCSGRKVKSPRGSFTKVNKSEPSINRIIYSSKNSDRSKNREHSISKEFVRNALSKSCVYCGFPSTGLDRIDNKIGHTEDNCVPCCKECNVARMNNFSHEEMFILGKAIKEIKDKRRVN